MSSPANKYSSAVSLTILALAVFIGFIQALIGTIALTPVISADYHRDLLTTFNHFSKSLSYLHRFVDKIALALFIRYFFATLQIVNGLGLAAVSYVPKFGHTANYILIAVNSLFLLLQFNIGASMEKIAAPFVFSILLVARLVLHEQHSKKQKPTKSRGGKQLRSSTPKKKVE